MDYNIIFKDIDSKKLFFVLTVVLLISISAFILLKLVNSMFYNTTAERIPSPMELYSKGKFSEALPGLIKEVKKNPKDANIQMALARSYEASNKLDEAVKHYETAGKLGKNAEAYYNAAIISKSQNDITKAIELMEEALKVRGDFSAALQQVAQLYEQIGDEGKAISIYEKLIELKPFGLDLTEARSKLENLEK